MEQTTTLRASIASALRDDIRTGRYRPGDKLPTEHAMAARFGVNRHTVRSALATLADEGLVHSRRGSGVFVMAEVTEYPIGRRVRYHQNLRAAGRVPAKDALSLELRAATRRESEDLELAPGETVLEYLGLSLSDAVPIAVFSSVFPVARLPGLDRVLREETSVTRALRAVGVSDYTRAWTRLTAVTADASQSQHLRVARGAPLLRSRGLNVADGKPVEFGTTWFAGDRTVLVLDDDDDDGGGDIA